MWVYKPLCVTTIGWLWIGGVCERNRVGLCGKY